MILNHYYTEDDAVCLDTYDTYAEQSDSYLSNVLNTASIEPLCLQLYTSEQICLDTFNTPVMWDPKRVTQFNQYTTRCSYDNSSNLVTTLCDHGCSECFFPDRICSFERDIYGDPAHCTDTGHLRFCRSHECPDAFKCHESYCIPIHMVCDMIPDCPDGEDEHECDAMVTEGMFRYYRVSVISNISMHLPGIKVATC